MTFRVMTEEVGAEKAGVICLDTCLFSFQFGKLDHKAHNLLECQPLHLSAN